MKLNNNAKQLAEDLNLTDADAFLMELKSNLYSKAAKLILKSELTHLEISQLIGTSRARITRLANLGENSVSIELLIKLCAVLENKPPIKIIA